MNTLKLSSFTVPAPKRTRLMSFLLAVVLLFGIVAVLRHAQNAKYDAAGNVFNEHVIAAAHLQGEKAVAESAITTEVEKGVGLRQDRSYRSVKKLELHKVSGYPESRLFDLAKNLCSISLAECDTATTQKLDEAIIQTIYRRNLPDGYGPPAQNITQSIPLVNASGRIILLHYINAHASPDSLSSISEAFQGTVKDALQKTNEPLYGIEVAFNENPSSRDYFSLTGSFVNSEGRVYDRTGSQLTFASYMPNANGPYKAVIYDEHLYLIPALTNPLRVYVDERSIFEKNGTEHVIELPAKDPCDVPYTRMCPRQTMPIERGKMYDLNALANPNGTKKIGSRDFLIRQADTLVYIHLIPTSETDVRSVVDPIAKGLQKVSPAQLNYLTLGE